MTERTYGNWRIDFDAKPIPYRGCDWTATHKDMDASYEGPEDGWIASHPTLYASTYEDLIFEIDEWEAEQ